MNRKQIGKIYVSRDMVWNQPDKVFKIFNMIEFLPVAIDFNFSADEMEFIGLSGWFHEKDTGVLIPTYVADIRASLSEDTEFGEVGEIKDVHLRKID